VRGGGGVECVRARATPPAAARVPARRTQACAGTHAAEMPLSPKVARVAAVGCADGVRNSESPLGREVHRGRALRRVGAAVDVVHAVAEVVTPRQDGGARGGAYGPARVKVHHCDAAGGGPPRAEAGRSGRAVRETEVRPPNVVPQHEEEGGLRAGRGGGTGCRPSRRDGGLPGRVQASAPRSVRGRSSRRRSRQKEDSANVHGDRS